MLQPRMEYSGGQTVFRRTRRTAQMTQRRKYERARPVDRQQPKVESARLVPEGLHESAQTVRRSSVPHLAQPLPTDRPPGLRGAHSNRTAGRKKSAPATGTVPDTC